jgi:glycosyl transferase, family 25
LTEHARVGGTGEADMSFGMRRLVNRFDRAYIINLPDRTDRLRLVSKSFDSIGIKIPNQKLRIYSAVRPTDKGDFYSLGARGAFNSHREVLKLAVADGLQNVLVFEDDVAFNTVPEDKVLNIINALPALDWDVVYFGYGKVELSPSDLGSPLLVWPQPTLGGHFYAVNGRFMGPMIQYMNECEARPINHPDGGPMSRDGAFNHIRLIKPEIQVWIAIPNLASQASSRSDLSPRFFDNILWLRPIISSVRQFKSRVQIFGS